jgi:hypothetical protein
LHSKNAYSLSRVSRLITTLGLIRFSSRKIGGKTLTDWDRSKYLVLTSKTEACFEHEGWLSRHFPGPVKNAGLEEV